MTLNEEVVLLRSRVEELEQRLTGVSNYDVSFAFALPPMLEKVFRLLLTNKRVTTQMIADHLGANIDVKMTMFRLRKHLKPHNVEVHSKRHIGYWLSDEAKEQLISAMELTPPSN